MIKKRILIIDDVKFMVKLISHILEGAGYEVTYARSGEEGLLKIRKEKPDLVLLDIIMPDMNGFEICKILRQDQSNNLTPIIILTSKDNEEDKLKGLELGADDYIVKPFNPRELISRVKNTLVRIDRNRFVNPLTGLNGNLEIQADINKRIACNELFDVLYVDLDNFKSYNDVYGFAKGDLVLKLTADIIIKVMNLFEDDSYFIGHIGGDDFIIITTPEQSELIAQYIIDDFDKKILKFYNQEDINRGYIVTTDRSDIKNRFPITGVSIAIVTNAGRDILDFSEFSELLAKVKKEAKSICGSTYIRY